MRRVWGFLSDPSLHLLAIAFVLIALAAGSRGPQEPSDTSPLVFCEKCRTNHYVVRFGSCPVPARVAQSQP